MRGLPHVQLLRSGLLTRRLLDIQQVNVDAIVDFHHGQLDRVRVLNCFQLEKEIGESTR